MEERTRSSFRYVNVDRQFASLDEKSRLDPEVLSYVGRLTTDRGWTSLLKEQCVVILAEAGSGKTRELIETSKRLREDGKAAFFIRLDTLESMDVAGACAPFESEFAAWLSGNEEGWFFLDARDEAKLTGKSFQVALATFRVGLNSSLSRAHVFISSRISDWRPHADLHLVDELLKRPAPVTVEDGDSVDATIDPLLVPLRRRSKRDDSKSDEAKSKNDAVLVVAMAALNKTRIEVLARAWGVPDGAKFMAALESEDAVELASRPDDLKALVGLWLEKGALGNHSELVQWSIDTRLNDPRVIDGKIEKLEPARAAAGARRLAAALTLARREAFFAPDSDPVANDNLAIDPYKLFKDWKPADVDAVLSTGLFDPHSYGRARFHTRISREYLAARWLFELKQSGGLARRDLDGLLFADLYGEAVVVPSMHSIAAWMSLWDSPVREEIIRRDPEILLSHGDPSQLELPTKRKLLARVVARVLTGVERVREYDSRVMRAFSDPKLGPDFQREWLKLSSTTKRASARGRSSAQILLLQLIRAGRARGAAKIAFEVATRRHQRDIVQRVGVSALLAVGDQELIKRFVGALLKNRKRWSVDVVRESLEELFPRYLSVNQTLTLVDALLQRTSDEVRGARYAVLAAVDNAVDANIRMQLLSGLAKRLQPRAKVTDDDQRTSPHWKQLGPGFQKLAARILVEDKPAQLTTPVALALVSGRESHFDQYDSHDERSQLSEALKGWKGRAGLFWLLLEKYDAWTVRYAQRMDLKVAYTDSFLSLDESDLVWLLAESRDESRRSQAVEAALTVWMRARRAVTVMARLRIFAAGHPAEIKKLDDAERPSEESEQIKRMHERQAEHARKQEEADQKRDQSWISFRERLRLEVDALQDPKERDTNEQFVRLQNLRAWLEMSGPRNHSRYSISNWEDLKAAFGDDVAVAAVAGFKIYWRGQSEKLPSERAAEDAGKIFESTLIGLAGLAIEARESDEWIEAIGREDIQAALRLALNEINRPPHWFSKLAKRHPQIVMPVLEREVRWALSPGNAPLGDHFMQGLRHDPVALDSRFRASLVKVLRQRTKFSDRSLKDSVDILMSAEATDAEALSTLAMAKLKLTNLTRSQRLSFLELLLHVDPPHAVTHIESLIKGAPPSDQRTEAEAIFATLLSHRKSIPVTEVGNAQVAWLERLVKMAYAWIRIGDDLPHDGVFEMSTRDDAEQARGRLLRELADLPGRETYDALLRLYGEPALGTSREWVLQLARARAEQDAAEAWKPEDVEKFELSLLKHPASGDELLALAVRRFNEINDQLTGGDFSQAELLQRFGESERDFQLWVADRLELLSRGAYVVTREDEVIRKKRPDIRLHSQAANAKVAVEMKVAGSYSGAQLVSALKRQLIGKYQLDEKCRGGVFVLVEGGKRKSWKVGKVLAKDVAALIALLRSSIKKPIRRSGVELKAAVLSLQI